MTKTEEIRERFEKKFPKVLKPLEQSDTRFMFLFEQIQFDVLDFFLAELDRILSEVESEVGEETKPTHPSECLASEHGELYCDCSQYSIEVGISQERSRVKSIINQKRRGVK